MINILIADDHPIIRQGLRKVLGTSKDMLVLDEAANGNEVLAKLRGDSFDVIILDISMPGESGLELIKTIRKEFPRLAVLVLSAYPEEQYALRALKTGASGYLTKEAAMAELIKAIHKISSGGKYISASMAESLAFAIESDTEKLPHEKLSNREYEVMLMIASAKSVKEIADELSLSKKTIGTYRSRILEKMDMKNGSEVTYYAMKNGLIE
ncbi:MAG: response regulator transcription factor [bacterium]|nr:response regulator transcription factor [bacterium]